MANEAAEATSGGVLDHGAMVWVPHDDQVWQKAVVVERVDNGLRAKVRLQPSEDGAWDLDTGTEKVVTIKDIARLAGEVSDEAMPICNDFDADGADDMCTLNHLHEPAVLKNLELRFAKKMPYTYTGAICIAVNPYQWLDLYGRELYEQYLEQPRDTLAPHPFALSATAYLDMKRTQVDQSILVSGESGAGKTETVKIMMNHLASVSGGGQHGTQVIDQVLQSNPLLESFGNAKTKRNDNSSRFGKFAQLQFDTMGSLVGCLCETYLLEKSRVVGQTEGERNYHVFYQIFRLSDERKQQLKLQGDVTSYKYVREGANAKLTGIEDVQCLKETQDAMDTIGITPDEQEAIFEIVAAILNLGELAFAPNANDSEKSHVSNEEIVDNVGALLRTERAALYSTLLERSITAGTESYTIPLNAEQASDLRDALAKGMYTQLFDWLVHRINKAICSTKNVKTHIGLLDIFGFESFDQNGFEQLCINYANEKLQQKFNSDVFKDVQQEYVDEGIPLTLVTFEDNQPILDLIEGRMGIVSLLNEEVLRPQATDSTFVSKVLDSCSDHPSIEKNRINPLEFTIHHYAGDVTYNGSGFLEKNKDTLPTDMVRLLSGSQSQVIAGIFTPKEAKQRNARGKNGKEGRQKGFLVGNTIAGAFRKQLTELMLTINKTSSQYVRCIKPNANKSAVEFNRLMIVEQLRCAGVIAAIRISRAAFPNRLPLVDFQQRFKIICPSALRDAEPSEMVAGLLKELLPDMATTMQNTKFAVGSSKVYFSSGLLQRLEDRRNVILKDHAILIQKTLHGYVARKRFLRKRTAVVTIQAITRTSLEVQRYRRLRLGMIHLQAWARGRKQRRLYALMVERVRQEREKEQERLRKIAQQEKETERLRQKEIDERRHRDPQPEPVEDDWSDESEKEEDDEEYEDDAVGPVSPRTLRTLTEAASKVAEAESAARDAKSAAEAALELNRELVAQNDRLRSTLSSNVAEYADAELLRENDRLKQQVLQLQTKLVRSQEVSLISAKVVDSRITYREGRQFVEYKLQIETNTRGTLYVWHRYSTFRNLAATLQTKNGYKRKEIPELPNKQLFGNFSEKIIQDRVAKLNQFLEAATNAEYLQWGIRVDQDTCVYKRRVKSASRESISTASMHSSSPRSSSRLSMKSFSFRRGSNAGN
ncbi:hypothetical protein PsorP6_005621 [Peronosclerospora sorghi]|uniref:Uncharacterized protein n=1 Tax=Peronosclerospora sorghi TaxID=230839 RepID=A0ACC0W4U9_9STRA|nr:hypothetical protein PsorP6_005621 [Peronosclerospora sorghi]